MNSAIVDLRGILLVDVEEYSSAFDGLCAEGISNLNISRYCYLFWQLVTKPTVYTQSSRSYCLSYINVISPTPWIEIIVCYTSECWSDATLGYVLILSEHTWPSASDIFVKREGLFHSAANLVKKNNDM